MTLLLSIALPVFAVAETFGNLSFREKWLVICVVALIIEVCWMMRLHTQEF